MKLSDIGERRAIDIMAGVYDTVTLDDCATIADGDDVLLVTSDMVNETSHFPRGASSRQMGWFTVAVNLSDLAGKGGRPLGVLLSLGLPGSLDADFLEDFAMGAHDCATAYDTSVIGGDTKEMHEVTLCGMALGRMRRDAYMSRTGAAPGDLVCVTGTLGRAGRALDRLRDGSDMAALHDLLHVEPRIDAGRALAATQAVHASMDISDGLAASLYQLSRVNGCGFAVDADRMPLSSHATLEHALYDGGDYELLFMVPPGAHGTVTEAAQDVGCPVSVVGEVIETRELLLRRDSGTETLEHRGYEHFTDRGKTL
ncbi:MAG: thiamine-phosphate kinase [Candidatus Thermoplasmatota archaeon]|nr:thiamine-phosphate kinase [Candidatus Thermoplasmatota archaeon]